MTAGMRKGTAARSDASSIRTEREKMTPMERGEGTTDYTDEDMMTRIRREKKKDEKKRAGKFERDWKAKAKYIITK